MAAAWWVIFNEGNEENRNNLRIIRRFLRNTQNPFDIPEKRFQEIYRLSREAVMQLHTDLDSYMPQARKLTAIPSILKILATLSFFASGSYQRRIGQDFLACMCQASISGAIYSVVEALNQIMPHWIIFPREHNDLELVKRQFWIHHIFPGVVGAVDGTHVAIWPPNKER